MKKYILLASIILSVVSCGKLTRDREVDKSKLRGYDYRLFQKTPAWELAKAVWDDDFKKINELTKKDTNLINYQDSKFGETLLFLTMWHNQKETFKLLLSLGANPNIHDTYDGTSPIIEACKGRLNIEFVIILSLESKSIVRRQSKLNISLGTVVTYWSLRKNTSFTAELQSILNREIKLT